MIEIPLKERMCRSGTDDDIKFENEFALTWADLSTQRIPKKTTRGTRWKKEHTRPKFNLMKTNHILILAGGFPRRIQYQHWMLDSKTFATEQIFSLLWLISIICAYNHPLLKATRSFRSSSKRNLFVPHGSSTFFSPSFILLSLCLYLVRYVVRVEIHSLSN